MATERSEPLRRGRDVPVGASDDTVSRMHGFVTVAIPTLNAGPGFARVLGAVRSQVLDRELELLVCDSSSQDGTADVARRHGARLLTIRREDFSHGATRNLLMSRAGGEHVAFLTQDAVPDDDRWLARLVEAFSLTEGVGVAFGPYRPRPEASASVARELEEWFGSFSDGGPRIDRLASAERDLAAREFLGHLGFFTDANGCVARTAWEQVPFRDVPYAEDHLLAQDMLRAGYAKVFLPGAAVVHSHEYTPWQWLRRSFDEARALHDVYGVVPRSHPRAAARGVRLDVGADRAWRRAHGLPGGSMAAARSLTHHAARAAGTVIGARSEALPCRLTAQLSLEGRR